jgi:hypothetical protein
MAQIIRAILLASATATTFFGRRASIASSQGVASRRPGLPAAVITDMAPFTSNARSRSLPARLIPPMRCLPPVACSCGVNPSQAAR